MNVVDRKIYAALLYLIKSGKKVTVSNIARYANIERPSIYHRLNKITS